MQAWPKEDFFNEDKRSIRVTNVIYCFFFCKLLACYNPSGYFYRIGNLVPIQKNPQGMHIRAKKYVVSVHSLREFRKRKSLLKKFNTQSASLQN